MLKIQPSEGKARLRVGGNATDQFEQVLETISLFENDLRQNGMDVEKMIASWLSDKTIHDTSRGARLIADPVGTGKSMIGLRLMIAWAERLNELGVVTKDGRKLGDFPILLVCDKSSKWQWEKYIRTWCPEWPLYQTVLLDGTPEQVALQMHVAEKVGAKLIICNYNKLTDYNEELRAYGHPWLMVCLDEIRRIKNASTQRNQAADALDAIYRIGLDGTPLTKEPNSLHAILSWLMPGKYSSRVISPESPKPSSKCPLRADVKRRFRKEGCWNCGHFAYDYEHPHVGKCEKTHEMLEGKPERKSFYHLYSPEWGKDDDFEYRYCQHECSACGARQNEDGRYTEETIDQRRCRHNGFKKICGALHLDELKERLNDETKVMTRINRKTIKGMPTVSYKWEMIEMTPEQSRFYAKAETGLIDFVNHEGDFQGVHLTNLLAQLSYLRSFATIPPSVVLAHLESGGSRPEWIEDVAIPKDGDSGKSRWVLEFISDYMNGEDKVIVFSEWTRMTHDLVSRINSTLKNGDYAVEIYGGLDDKKREANKVAFNSYPKCKVAVCSPSANASLNLHNGVHGDGVLYVINVDCSWLPADLDQRIGRAQRFGFDGAAIIAYFLMSVKDEEHGTIDSRMAKRVMDLAILFDKVFDDVALGSMFKFSGRSDIMALLTD